MRTFSLLFLLLLLSAWGAQAQTSARGTGAVHLSEEVRYYDIVGRTENDLLQAMLRGGPVSGGSRYFGLTSTEIRYTYWKTPASIGCDLTDIEVHLRVVTTLPRWQPFRGTAYEVERRWRSFDRALRIHENGHKQFALEEADMIWRALESVRAPSCDVIDAEARGIASRIRDTYVLRHNAYDGRTDHGTTQGAVWPLTNGR
ncbi:MAG: DUF922 domain-containing protein [Bacteroidetes bacterium]|nr:DUF922 domain-containing protein [Bacteroidota bacterium]